MKRIQRKRTKGWRMPPNTVYVGRGSKWGNPFRVGHEAISAEDAKRKFRMMTDRPENKTYVAKIIHELKGKDLACWCKEDAPCHGDILLELANGAKP